MRRIKLTRNRSFKTAILSSGSLHGTDSHNHIISEDRHHGSAQRGLHVEKLLCFRVIAVAVGTGQEVTWCAMGTFAC